MNTQRTRTTTIAVASRCVSHPRRVTSLHININIIVIYWATAITRARSHTFRPIVSGCTTTLGANHHSGLCPNPVGTLYVYLSYTSINFDTVWCPERVRARSLCVLCVLWESDRSTRVRPSSSFCPVYFRIVWCGVLHKHTHTYRHRNPSQW